MTELTEHDKEVLEEIAFDLGYNWEDLKETLKNRPLAVRAIIITAKKARQATEERVLKEIDNIDFYDFLDAHGNVYQNRVKIELKNRLQESEK